MKKSLYIFILTILGIAVTSCNPMDDINEVIDAQINSDQVKGTVDTYTLTDDDYTALDLEFGSFNSLDDAKALIPQVLKSQFPVLGNGSLANVTFNLYAPIRVEDYTATAQDYTDAGISTGYVSSNAEVSNLLKLKFPQAAQGDYVSLTYNSTSEEVLYTINEVDFALIGEQLGGKYPEPASSAAQYKNFDRREGQDAYWNEEMILEAINAVLLNNFENTPGQKYNVSYAIYNGSAGTESMSVLFDGNAYVAVNSSSYQLVNSDYAYVGSEFADTYPEAATSAGKYNNFESREDNAAYWNDAMLLEALNAVLKNNFPDAPDGAKYQVTYTTYNGTSGTGVMSLILKDGAYIVDENAGVSTIEKTSVFAFTSGNWSAPFILQPDDYTAMGQSYPNFDNADEALYKIGIFLGKAFPYAEPDDFVALAYNFYASGGTTTQYANYTFNGDKWSNIPSTIEQTLQFGNDGETWVPDNTINYSLSNADYEYIAEVLGAQPEYAGIVATLSDYHDYDSNWSHEQILESLFVLAEHNFPNAEIGQKYDISYVVYDGGAAELTASIILTEDGWAEQE